jgi:hypothetical protein
MCPAQELVASSLVVIDDRPRPSAQSAELGARTLEVLTSSFSLHIA